MSCQQEIYSLIKFNCSCQNCKTLWHTNTTQHNTGVWRRALWLVKSQATSHTTNFSISDKPGHKKCQKLAPLGFLLDHGLASVKRTSIPWNSVLSHKHHILSLLWLIRDGAEQPRESREGRRAHNVLTEGREAEGGGNFRRHSAQWVCGDGVHRAKEGLARSDGSLITASVRCFLSGVLFRNTSSPGKPSSAHHGISALPVTRYPPHQYFPVIIKCSMFWTLSELPYHTQTSKIGCFSMWQREMWILLLIFHPPIWARRLLLYHKMELQEDL